MPELCAMPQTSLCRHRQNMIDESAGAYLVEECLPIRFRPIYLTSELQKSFPPFKPSARLNGSSCIGSAHRHRWVKSWRWSRPENCRVREMPNWQPSFVESRCCESFVPGSADRWIPVKS